MGLHQFVLTLFTGILFGSGVYHLARCAFVSRRRCRFFYFGLTALAGAGFVFLQLRLSLVANEGAVLVLHHLKLACLIAGLASWMRCICDIYFPESRFPHIFGLVSGMLALGLPFGLFLSDPVIHVVLDWDWIRFDYRFGTARGLYAVYAVFVAVGFGYAFYRIIREHGISRRARLVGLAAFLPGLMGALDFSMVLGVWRGPMMAEYFVFLFLMTAFVHFFRMEQRSQVRLAELNADLEHGIRERTTELEEANRRLQQAATTDALTGLVNRREFKHLVRQEIQRARRFDAPGASAFSLCYLDLDNFKVYNDTFGHRVGDLILDEFAGLLRHACRNIDVAARYGGDEFVLLLPSTDIPGATLLSGRILAELLVRERFHPEIVRLTGKPVQIPQAAQLSCSIGVAEYRNDGNPDVDVEILLSWADEALMRAKQDGKNCVRCHGT